jgi:hypothetical protein
MKQTKKTIWTTPYNSKKARELIDTGQEVVIGLESEIPLDTPIIFTKQNGRYGFKKESTPPSQGSK